MPCEVLLLTCQGHHREWLVLDTEEPADDCQFCAGAGGWIITASWTLTALPWWEVLRGRVLGVESAWYYLRTLGWYATREHPAGPIGSHVVTPGMQLIPTPAPNGDTTWSWSPTAGSEN